MCFTFSARPFTRSLYDWFAAIVNKRLCESTASFPLPAKCAVRDYGDKWFIWLQSCKWPFSCLKHLKGGNFFIFWSVYRSLQNIFHEVDADIPFILSDVISRQAFVIYKYKVAITIIYNHKECFCVVPECIIYRMCMSL